MKQLSFLPKENKFFGGALLAGRRKSKRPLDSRCALHTVVKSSWARGAASFNAKSKKERVEEIVREQSEKHGIRLYRFAIADNHIHFLLRAKKRRHYRAWIAATTGKVASLMMNNLSFKEFTSGARGSFFDHRPFTRIISWGRDFVIAGKYLLKNQLEALGFIAYRPRKHNYERWLRRVKEFK